MVNSLRYSVVKQIGLLALNAMFVPGENLFGAKVFIPKKRGRIQGYDK